MYLMQTMIRIIVLLLCFPVFASWKPKNESNLHEQESNFRIFKQLNDKWKILAEYKYRNQFDQTNLKSIRIGTYYRAKKNIKLGFFYKNESGLRHNDDWVKENGVWKWQDTQSRKEDLYIADFTYRKMVINWDWVFELKNRLQYNNFNDNTTYKLRPGLTYFWKKDGLPFMNFFFQYELYHGLNFGDELIYERWGYAGFLYHLTHEIKIGGSLARKKVVWNESQSVVDIWPTRTYSNEVTSYVYALNFYYIF